jgi:hypothetical protein
MYTYDAAVQNSAIGEYFTQGSPVSGRVMCNPRLEFFTE